MATTVPGRSFIGTFGFVFLAIAALFAADTFLARTEQAESTVEASRLFNQGRQLMQAGKHKEAAERIQEAISMDRGNRVYSRTLAEDQLAAGDTAGAESTLTELLQTNPTDGLANLIMARVLVKEERFAEAISYFHRAVYGKWKENDAENRRRARFELIDFLAQHNSKEELLAELLPVEDSAPTDMNTRIRLGRLFLLAGSPTRSSELFRGILRDDPANTEALTGLGEAEYARGNYRSAQRDFADAIRLGSDDQTARKRLEECNELLALDPTVRGLSSSEHLSRSVKLVELTAEETRNCIGQDPSPEVQSWLDKAVKAVDTRVKAGQQNEAYESNLDLAAQLWQIRKKDCKTPPATDTPLALVLTALAR